MKGGQAPGGRSEHGQRRKAAYGTAAGDEAHTGMMILASAMRHSVGRPATGMGGGTKILWSGFASRRLKLPLFSIVNNRIQHRPMVRNLSIMRLTVRRIFYLTGEADEKRTSKNRRSHFT